MSSLGARLKFIERQSRIGKALTFYTSISGAIMGILEKRMFKISGCLKGVAGLYVIYNRAND